MMTAVTPPMNSETGFLNTLHDTESGATNAGSPGGRKKSTEDWSPGSRSARVASSKPIFNGHSRTRGVFENDILKNQFCQAAIVAAPLKAEIGIHCNAR
jgi:hypothetical protein